MKLLVPCLDSLWLHVCLHWHIHDFPVSCPHYSQTTSKSLHPDSSAGFVFWGFVLFPLNTVPLVLLFFSLPSFFCDYIFLLCVWVFFLHGCLCPYPCSAHWGQKRVLEPLELQLQIVVRCLGWVLGADHESSSAVCALNCKPSLQTPVLFL